VLREEKYHKVMDRIISAFETSPKELGRTLWLDNERVKKLDQMGHCIGLHSFSHPTRMEDFSSDLQLEEYQKNFRHLSDLLGEVPQVMSHPCNSYSNETLRILRDLGIVLGFRSQMNPPTPDSMLEWPREDHTNVMSQFRLRA
jgi:peptidoglycan/xylan/chitin deacetylase (PgdA/CDA1 family)